MPKDFPEKVKVFAYILRNVTSQPEVLIFAHRDFPEAGLQVPAGTVEEGEEKEKALLREIKEESGLEGFTKVQYIGTQLYEPTDKEEIHHRYFFQVHFEGESPDTFSHVVQGKGEDQGLIFEYRWVALPELPPLIADHGRLIPWLFLLK